MLLSAITPLAFFALLSCGPHITHQAPQHSSHQLSALSGPQYVLRAVAQESGKEGEGDTLSTMQICALRTSVPTQDTSSPTASSQEPPTIDDSSCLSAFRGADDRPVLISLSDLPPSPTEGSSLKDQALQEWTEFRRSFSLTDNQTIATAMVGIGGGTMYGYQHHVRSNILPVSAKPASSLPEETERVTKTVAVDDAPINKTPTALSTSPRGSFSSPEDILRHFRYLDNHKGNIPHNLIEAMDKAQRAHRLYHESIPLLDDLANLYDLANLDDLARRRWDDGFFSREFINFYPEKGRTLNDFFRRSANIYPPKGGYKDYLRSPEFKYFLDRVTDFLNHEGHSAAEIINLDYRKAFVSYYEISKAIDVKIHANTYLSHSNFADLITTPTHLEHFWSLRSTFLASGGLPPNIKTLYLLKDMHNAFEAFKLGGTQAIKTLQGAMKRSIRALAPPAPTIHNLSAPLSASSMKYMALQRSKSWGRVGALLALGAGVILTLDATAPPQQETERSPDASVSDSELWDGSWQALTTEATEQVSSLPEILSELAAATDNKAITQVCVPRRPSEGEAWEASCRSL